VSTFTAGKKWGNVFIQGKRVGSLYKGGVRIYNAPVPNNLTQWDARWAKIDVDAGYTTINYTDENGVPVTPVAANMTVCCVGTRASGKVYYYVSGNQYQLDLATGVVSLLWSSATNYTRFSINEETGAVFAGASWDGRIAPSIETFLSAPNLSASVGSMTALAGPMWVDNMILTGNRLRDSSGEVVHTLPAGIGASTYRSTVFTGNSKDGYFLCDTDGSNAYPRRLYRYNLENNTADFMFETSQVDMNHLVVDSVNSAGIRKVNNVAEVCRTYDGVNFNAPLLGATANGTYLQNRCFQHIGMNIVPGQVWWNMNDDTVGLTSTANSLFPGYVTGHFYAGKQMLVNGNRLWDIVPKPHVQG